MKKIYYLLMAAFAVMCVCPACSSDDEKDDKTENGETITANAIVGTWKCVKCEGYEIYDGEKNEWNETYDDPNDYWGLIFNANGTGTDYYYYEGETDSFDIEWTLSGKKLKISFYEEESYETDEYEVESLTSTQLVIVEYWESEDGREKEMEKYTYSRVK